MAFVDEVLLSKPSELVTLAQVKDAVYGRGTREPPEDVLRPRSQASALLKFLARRHRLTRHARGPPPPIGLELLS